MANAIVIMKLKVLRHIAMSAGSQSFKGVGLKVSASWLADLSELGAPRPLLAPRSTQ